MGDKGPETGVSAALPIHVTGAMVGTMAFAGGVNNGSGVCTSSPVGEPLGNVFGSLGLGLGCGELFVGLMMARSCDAARPRGDRSKSGGPGGNKSVVDR